MIVGDYEIPVSPALTAHLTGFRHHEDWKAKEYYFWKIADLLWNRPEFEKPMFERNPWSEYTVREALKEKYLAIGGAANSAKSHTMAGFAIISWLADPSNTLVLITSTTLTEARKRIWGSVIRLMTVIEDIAPCKIRDSIGSIAYKNEGGTLFDTAGLSLIAGDKSKARQASAKFIGIKAPKIIVIADELSELSPSIIESCMANLSKNENLQVKAMSNPNSMFDAFGDWATPKGGWDSVNVLQDDEWRTSRGGKYIRLDGERSPNVLAGKVLYPYLPTIEQLEEDRAVLGPESRGYMRMVRAIFFDSDDEEVVFSEQEIANSGSTNKVRAWNGPPNRVAGLDPGFTNGGDRCVLYTGLVGYDADTNAMVFELENYHLLFDDANDKTTSRSLQIAKQVKTLCTKLKVPPENLAVDATGAGEPFCDVVAGEWSNRFIRVQFGGKATDKRVSDVHRRTGTELYANRVSELWYVGKELNRTRQLKGVTPEFANEIVKRTFELTKALNNLRVRIESKDSFKQRIGRSPDLADAGFLALDAARTRYGLTAIEPIDYKDNDIRLNMPRPHRKISHYADALESDMDSLPEGF